MELETNTILLPSGHNSYNRTIQVVPLLKTIYLRFSNFYDSTQTVLVSAEKKIIYEGWNFNSGNYLLTTDTK